MSVLCFQRMSLIKTERSSEESETEAFTTQTLGNAQFPSCDTVKSVCVCVCVCVGHGNNESLGGKQTQAIKVMKSRQK